jgi:hypothetical protein
MVLIRKKIFLILKIVLFIFILTDTCKLIVRLYFLSSDYTTNIPEEVPKIHLKIYSILNQRNDVFSENKNTKKEIHK